MTMRRKRSYGRRLTIDRLNDEGCRNFLFKFLKILSRDYTDAFGKYIQNPTDGEAKEQYESLRSYFESDFFSNLTNLDGRSIADKLEQFYLESPDKLLRETD